MEATEIHKIGAQPVKNSGRNHYKGDFQLGRFIGDVKEAAKSFTLNEKVWAKLVTDSLTYSGTRFPVLLVVLGGKTRLAVIEWGLFEEMRAEYEKTNSRL